MVRFQRPTSSDETTSPLRTLSATATVTPDALRNVAHLRRLRRNQEVFGQDERSDDWYSVVGGALREYALHSDGRRQIIDILLPGDFFGFTLRSHRWFGVQAVAEDTTIECYPRQRVEVLADNDPSVSREIRARCFQAIERLEAQMLVVGTMTSPGKVRAFLTHFCDRLASTQGDGALLPISRYDIADMLGISVETVCRAFTELQERGLITLEGPRRITVMGKRDLVLLSRN
jgi:CRP/FNR family transcriptional regulator, nitrogen fixation regulation protein